METRQPPPRAGPGKHAAPAAIIIKRRNFGFSLLSLPADAGIRAKRVLPACILESRGER
jgi:hypothetical protein